MKILGVIVRKVEVHILTSTDKNVRVDIYDPELEVINRFDELKKVN